MALSSPRAGDLKAQETERVKEKELFQEERQWSQRQKDQDLAPLIFWGITRDLLFNSTIYLPTYLPT